MRPNLPVLILSARDGLEEKVRHFEAGADDYLTKPFNLAELVVRIKALLRRGHRRVFNHATDLGPSGRSCLPTGPQG